MTREEITLEAMKFWPIDEENDDLIKMSYQSNMIGAFRDGAEWAQDVMLDKACEWLEKNLYATVKTNYDNIVGVESTQAFLEKFKQAMKSES